MNLISYAQNYEDIMLWRALKHIEQGVYIDVGANDPIEHSTTKLFYDRGWHGINLEPVEKWYDKLILQRPRDINLKIAAGDFHGNLQFFEVVDTGLSTANREYAQRYARENGYEVKECSVSVQTLTEIVKEQNFSEIHFLKIDVEGEEESVLKGLDFSAIRPWIVLVEATKPLTEIPDHNSWEILLTSNHYKFVYFDGLNRFYIANEHIKLADTFALPPNIWDEFITFPRHEIQQKHSQLETQYSQLIEQYHCLNKDLELSNQAFNQNIEKEHELELEMSNLMDLVHQKELRLQQLEAELEVILNSTSMLMTEPFRALGRLLRKIADANQVRGFVKKKLKRAVRTVGDLPIAMRLYKLMQPYIPYQVKNRLKGVYFSQSSVSFNKDGRVAYQEYLSPMAQQVLDDIKEAIKTKR
ncbi:MAG: FkbM family methyltransferase [Leptolyngbyaceae cyanobacterium]